MRNSLHKIGLFILLIIITFYGCKKEREHRVISPIVMELGYFKINSYWIFKNNVTNLTDCTYIAKDPNIYTVNLDNNDTGPLQDEIVIDFEGEILSSYHLLGDFILAQMSFEHYCEVFRGSIGLGEDFIDGYTRYSYVRFYDSLQTNNHMFYSVYHTKYLNITREFDTITYDIFSARYIGPIIINKKVNSVDTTWTILRWNIHH